ncbi:MULTISPECIES: CoA-binding protein [unclassified Meiothermus]|uniref:CoA-binding protein n=1 Tax=unclassified Meiothermus TaxID=370471 RepID=UPI000D7CE01E|nr:MULTISPECIES: CoA-binding protein [unclassified Meiothermus]PZA06294.1 CoA-binding protein [Meiothermus sp. Pnk-1]RYM36379.1 CoA-binding protein [Meiothermus sp. PNK-Is4]
MTQTELRHLLAAARTIAVLGAHPDPSRAAFYVPDYLWRHGYRILPTNPVFAGQTLWGERVRADLSEILEPVDILDVFRRSDALPTHLEGILALRPKLVWLQSGIRNDAFARTLEELGIGVIQDRCLMVVHRQLLGAWDRSSSRGR